MVSIIHCNGVLLNITKHHVTQSCKAHLQATQYLIVLYSSVSYKIVQYGTKQYILVHNSALQYRTVQNRKEQNGELQYGAEQYNFVQNNSEPYSRYKSVHIGTEQYETLKQYGT